MYSTPSFFSQKRKIVVHSRNSEMWKTRGRKGEEGISGGES
jgi:hypothetical protein